MLDVAHLASLIPLTALREVDQGPDSGTHLAPSAETIRRARIAAGALEAMTWFLDHCADTLAEVGLLGSSHLLGDTAQELLGVADGLRALANGEVPA